MMALQVSKVTKSYNTVPVLQGITFTIAAGERVALMGPSGSGKSTLLNCIAGIDRPDEGSIEIEGESLGQMDEVALCRLRRETVSSVFQFFHLLPTLSVRENIEFPLQLKALPRSERDAKVSALIEEVGLTHRAEAPPHELSGGEMQRVAIARALIIEPRLILADEPTGNLDSVTGETILDLLERLSEQYRIAMLLVTHSRQVTRICGRTLELHDGRIITQSLL